VAWNSGRRTDMTHKNVFVVVLLFLLIASALVIRYVGFRCEALPVANVQLRTATICYSWFQPRMLTFSDRSGRPFYHGIITKSFSFGDLPAQEYVDLFGSGKISGFSTNHLDPRYGFVGTQEMSTRDDGRVDLVFGFHGRALTKAVKIDIGRCSSWKSETISFAGRVAAKQVCTDPKAAQNITAAEARELVARMRVPPDHELFALGRLEGARGKPVGQYLPM
jgi:hypothetical protein